MSPLEVIDSARDQLLKDDTCDSEDWLEGMAVLFSIQEYLEGQL